MSELARRATECKGWRWLPGMLARTTSTSKGAGDARVYWLHPEPRLIHLGGNTWPLSMHGPYLPDLTDPATLGCLLALVREAWGRPCAHVAKPIGGPWVLCDVIGQPLHMGLVSTGGLVGGDSEAEALVAALEAAP
jgi:hypothetical protein